MAKYIDLSCKLAVTITLSKRMYDLTPRNQHKLAIEYILTTLKEHGIVAHVLIAELTQNCNVHYHGVVQIPLKRGRPPREIWYNIWRRSSIVGYTLIKIVDDEKGWQEYIEKNIKETEEILNYVVWTNDKEARITTNCECETPEDVAPQHSSTQQAQVDCAAIADGTQIL